MVQIWTLGPELDAVLNDQFDGTLVDGDSNVLVPVPPTAYILSFPARLLTLVNPPMEVEPPNGSVVSARLRNGNEIIVQRIDGSDPLILARWYQARVIAPSTWAQVISASISVTTIHTVDL